MNKLSFQDKIGLAFLALLFGAVLLIFWSFPKTSGVLAVAFLDVGQGDAIFIETPTKNQILLDAGKDNRVLKELAAFMPFYDRTIDLMIASHYQQDHFGGFFDALKRYKAGLALGPDDELFKLKNEWFNILQSKKITLLALKRGARIHLDNGLFLDVLSPFENDERKTAKQPPLLIGRLVFGKTAFLLTADAEFRDENMLIGSKTNVRADVLKVAHHGSKYSTSEFWLKAVNPAIAVISVGKNSYGHPTKETLGRLQKSNILALQTLLNGSIIFKSDGTKIWKDK